MKILSNCLLGFSNSFLVSESFCATAVTIGIIVVDCGTALGANLQHLRGSNIHTSLTFLTDCQRSTIFSTTKPTIDMVPAYIGGSIFPINTVSYKITNFVEKAGHRHYVPLLEDKHTQAYTGLGCVR
jgi:hypothetical protein